MNIDKHMEWIGLNLGIYILVVRGEFTIEEVISLFESNHNMLYKIGSIT